MDGFGRLAQGAIEEVIEFRPVSSWHTACNPPGLYVRLPGASGKMALPSFRLDQGCKIASERGAGRRLIAELATMGHL